MKRRPQQHYEAVAHVWKTEWAKRGGKPNIAVAQRWGVPYSTAARWVKRARQIGVLDQQFKRAHTCPGCGTRIECECAAPPVTT
jgi:transposase